MATLTLKSHRKATPATSLITVAAGRDRQQKQESAALLNHLQGVIQSSSRLFIQMRHGAGYCGVPVSLEDGWLTMNAVSIHGTKKTVQAHCVLIQIQDGSFIAHLHAIENFSTGVTK